MPDLVNGTTRIQILKNGAIGKIMDDQVMVDQVAGNALDGGLMNVYLRIRQGETWLFQPLLGPDAKSTVKFDATTAVWSGTFQTLHYQLQLDVCQGHWFWQAKVADPEGLAFDLTYVQDLGMGTEGYVTSNEAYAAQYLDHFVVQSGDQITIGSRQNQDQNGRHPYIQQGSFSGLASFSTDGNQFFGTHSRLDSVPQAMQTHQLANQKIQYESGVIALRTPLQTTDGEVVFYAAVCQDQPDNNQTLLIDSQELAREFEQVQQRGHQLQALMPTKRRLKLGTVIAGQPLSAAELERRFPQRCQVEMKQGQVQSFFTPTAEHVVLQSKELEQERPTGNIVMAETAIVPGKPVLATTQFMAGVFESHVVFGNTNTQMLTTHTRDSLNLLKVTGTRIYLSAPGETTYHLLGVPSAYVMSYNGGDWIYQLADDVIEISDDAEATAPQLTLRFRSQQGRKYRVLVTTQLSQPTLGQTPIVTRDQQTLQIMPELTTLMAQRNPQLGYQIDYQQNDAQALVLGDEGLIFEAGTFEPTDQLVAHYQETSAFVIKTGLVGHEIKNCDLAQVRRQHQQAIETLLHGIELATPNPEKQALVEQTNLVLRWFAHDDLVHLLSPHGLEQYGGAAWGTRDVSQGPVELFTATGRLDLVRAIILKLYQHQFVEDGNWPQWFMYDEYADMFADESHGDIIVWPLKVVVDYLKLTQDDELLNVQLPYMSRTTKQATAQTASLREHIIKQLTYLKTHFLPGTYISGYGDGDWDDTLQPANATLKQGMASTWTMELTIETMRLAEQVFANDALIDQVAGLAAKMSRDFQKYFMTDDTLPGFIYLDQDQHVRQIIHPNDHQTGIDYRLLPLSQGVLSQILTGTAADEALALIKEHLLFPDGVRLMNKPSTYHGGVSETFKRAEQAANFGREIGLLYVHAHIRYANAIADHGDQAQAWHLLQLVNPINLQQRVSNAETRQSNVYFSSSDADFADRYTAQRDFDQLRTQQVGVKGGWRLYSSGPGIYIGTLLRSVFRLTDVETFKRVEEGLSLPFDPEIKITNR